MRMREGISGKSADGETKAQCGQQVMWFLWGRSVWVLGWGRNRNRQRKVKEHSDGCCSDRRLDAGLKGPGHSGISVPSLC